MLRNSDGKWLKDKDQLMDHIKNFHKILFHDDLKDKLRYAMKNSFLLNDDKQNEKLTKSVTDPKVQKAMWSIGGSKAPGADSFLAKFYHYN